MIKFNRLDAWSFWDDRKKILCYLSAEDAILLGLLKEKEVTFSHSVWNPEGQTSGDIWQLDRKHAVVWDQTE